MGTDKLTEMSKRIYSNHRELFDFIYDHKPDVLDDVRKILDDQIVKRGWILGSASKKYLRFTTQKILDLTYINKKANSWKKKEAYLLEFVLNPEKDRMNFKSVISRSDSNYDSNRLSEMLMEINGFKSPIGKIWLVNYQKLEKFPFSTIEEFTNEEIASEFNKILDKCALIVKKIEDKFTSNSEELLKMK